MTSSTSLLKALAISSSRWLMHRRRKAQPAKSIKLIRSKCSQGSCAMPTNSEISIIINKIIVIARFSSRPTSIASPSNTITSNSIISNIRVRSSTATKEDMTVEKVVVSATTKVAAVAKTITTTTKRWLNRGR